jgi:N-acetylneuraminic acid mutarotase
MTRKFMQTVPTGLAAAAAVGLGVHADPVSLSDAVFPPLPEAVASFGATTLDDWLYVYGGHRGERHQYNSEDVSGAFHRLNLAKPTAWERLPSSLPLQGAALVAHAHALYRVGGMAAQNGRDEDHDLQSTAAVERYDVRRASWEDLPPLPAPRSSHDAAILGDTLYVGGGWQLHGGDAKATWHESLLSLDLSRPGSAWETHPQPFKRRALALAAVRPKLYCIGGMGADNKTALTVDVFDTVSGAWSPGPDLPAGPMKGFGCSAAPQGDRLYFSGMKGELHRLSAAGDAWEFVGKLHHARFFHRLVSAGTNGLIAVGGEDSESKRADLEFISVPATASDDAALGIIETQTRHAQIVNP